MAEPLSLERDLRTAAALRRLRELGAIQGEHLSGMRLGRVPDAHDHGHWLYVRLGERFAQPSDGHAWVPDTSDAITVALLGLRVEEAWQDPTACLEPHLFGGWRCSYGPCLSPVYATKADAWLEALEARVAELEKKA